MNFKIGPPRNLKIFWHGSYDIQTKTKRTRRHNKKKAQLNNFKPVINVIKTINYVKLKH